MECPQAAVSVATKETVSRRTMKARRTRKNSRTLPNQKSQQFHLEMSSNTGMNSSSFLFFLMLFYYLTLDQQLRIAFDTPVQVPWSAKLLICLRVKLYWRFSTQCFVQPSNKSMYPLLYQSWLVTVRISCDTFCVCSICG